MIFIGIQSANNDRKLNAGYARMPDDALEFPWACPRVHKQHLSILNTLHILSDVGGNTQIKHVVNFLLPLFFFCIFFSRYLRIHHPLGVRDPAGHDNISIFFFSRKIQIRFDDMQYLWRVVQTPKHIITLLGKNNSRNVPKQANANRVPNNNNSNRSGRRDSDKQTF